MDGYIFEDLKNLDYVVFAPSLWHQHFRMFELNEIMHQRNSKVVKDTRQRPILIS